MNDDDELVIPPQPVVDIAKAEVKDSERWQWGKGQHVEIHRMARKPEPKPLLLPGEKRKLRVETLKEKRAERADKAASKAMNGFDLRKLYRDMMENVSAESDSEAGRACLHDVLMTPPLNKFMRKIVWRLAAYLYYDASDKGSSDKRAVTLTAIRSKSGSRRRPDDQQCAAADKIVNEWFSSLRKEGSGEVRDAAGLRDAARAKEQEERRKEAARDPLLDLPGLKGVGKATKGKKTTRVKPVVVAFVAAESNPFKVSPAVAVAGDSVTSLGEEAKLSTLRISDPVAVEQVDDAAKDSAQDDSVNEDADTAESVDSASREDSSDAEDGSGSELSDEEKAASLDHEEEEVHMGLGFHGPHTRSTSPMSSADDDTSGSDSSSIESPLRPADVADVPAAALYVPSELRGEWEHHTTGIGSKLMAKMGYRGGFLGRRAGALGAGTESSPKSGTRGKPARRPFVRPSAGEKAARKAVAAGDASTPDGRTIVRASADMPAPIEAVRRPTRRGIGAD